MLAYIHSSKETAPLIRRVDTAQLLLATSLRLAKLPSAEDADGTEAAPPFAHARKVMYPEGIKARTTISRNDSLLAENVTVEEKSSIRESVIGANCQIKEGAKLSQCLLMEGVVIGKGCKLTRCILGKRCEIGEGSTLTDCEVQENLFVEPKCELFPSFFFPSSAPLNLALQLTFAAHSRGEGREAHVQRGPGGDRGGDAGGAAGNGGGRDRRDGLIGLTVWPSRVTSSRQMWWIVA